MPSYKLAQIHRELILDWLAEGFRLVDIQQRLSEEFDIAVRHQTVAYYQDHYEAEILKRRDELKRGILERIPFANRYARVARLDAIASEYWRRGKKDKFIEVTKQIRDEMAKLGDNPPMMPGVNVTVNNQVGASASASAEATVNNTVGAFTRDDIRLVAELARSVCEYGPGGIHTDPLFRGRIGGCDGAPTPDGGGAETPGA